MSIPASVTLYANWVHGSLVSTTYTQDTPEVPDAFTWTFDGSITVESASPWNGQSLADFTSAFKYTEATLTSTEIQATSGRFLIEFEPPTGTGDAIFTTIRSATSQDYIYVRRVSGELIVEGSRNYSAGFGSINLGTFPTGANTVEVIYDFNNGTGADRVKARTWAVGGSAGSFSTCSWSGSGGTTQQWNYITLGFDLRNRYGRVIVSNSTSEDLSAVSEDAAVALMGAMSL